MTPQHHLTVFVTDAVNQTEYSGILKLVLLAKKNIVTLKPNTLVLIVERTFIAYVSDVANLVATDITVLVLKQPRRLRVFRAPEQQNATIMINLTKEDRNGLFYI